MSTRAMLQGRVDEEVERLRRYRTDSRSVEAKSCAGGLSRNAIESVCAFANSGGGLLLLGLAEEDGFRAVDIHAARLAAELASACADDLEPPIRPLVELCIVDGRSVVAAWVDALEAAARPCHVLRRGLEHGTFLRTHDGDRRASRYEVQVMLSSRTRPRDDVALVPGATLADLDPARVGALVARLRRTRPRVFGPASDADVLRRLGVCGAREDDVTLAGLLALGTYPQEFLPQLNVTFVAYPTPTGEAMHDGTRFLDNQALDGPIPVMVADAMAALRRNMRRGAIITGAGREDRWDYPELAVRELLVNAIVHRDYHPSAHGTQVRMALYPDRLEIVGPGGLWGPLDARRLLTEPEPASRNERLAKLLEDVETDDDRRPVCENRGTGLLAAMASLRRSNREPPAVRDDVRSLTMVLRRHDVIDDDLHVWLRSVGLDPSTRVAHGLALMHRHGRLSGDRWRAATGADGHDAAAELESLRRAGLVERDDRASGRGWRAVGVRGPDAVAEASIADPPRHGGLESRRRDRREHIRTLLASGPRSTRELADAIGIGRAGVQRWLVRMERDGELAPTDPEARRSPNNRWRLVVDAAP